MAINYEEFYRSTFGVTDEKLLKEVADVSVFKKLKSKEYLIRAGEPTVILWINVKGIFRGILTTDEGKDITDCFSLHTGDILFAGFDIKLGEKSHVDLQAVTPCEVVGIPMNLVMMHMSNKNPDLLNICQKALEMAVKRHIEVARMRTLPVPERIRWFRETMGQMGDVIEDQYVASWLSMDRSTYCREKKKLSE